MSLKSFPRLAEVRRWASDRPCCQAADIAAHFGMHLRTAQSYAQRIRDEWRTPSHRQENEGHG